MHTELEAQPAAELTSPSGLGDFIGAHRVRYMEVQKPAESGRTDGILRRLMDSHGGKLSVYYYKP